MIRLPEAWRAFWPLPLRLVAGGALAVAGAFKVFTDLGHRNVEAELVALGAPLPEAMAWAVGVAELTCGLGLLLGAWTALCSLLMLANLGGLLFLCAVQGVPHPESLGLEGLGYFPYRLPSLEAAAVLLAVLAALLLGGPGPWSWEERKPSQR